MAKIETAFPATDWYAVIGDKLVPVVTWIVDSKDPDDEVWGLIWDETSMMFVDAEEEAGFVKFVYSRNPKADTRSIDHEELAVFVRDQYAVDDKSWRSMVNTEVVHELAHIHARHLINEFLNGE